MAGQYSTVLIYHLPLTHSSLGGHLGVSTAWLVSSAAVDICVQAPVEPLFSILSFHPQ